VILSTHIVSDVEASATGVAILHKGRLLAHSTPEDLLRGIESEVWEWVIPSRELAEARARHLISAAVRRSDGVHVRVVAGAPPGSGARSVRPKLEDAYLHFISNNTGEHRP
jgi:ABC-type multidrug transport system ATPase subunit